MTEAQSGGVAEQEADFAYPVRIEDAGPATKRVTVDIPAERIDAKLSEQFNELRQQAAVPGFRAGRVPAKLIERKFSADVREQVCRALVSESYQHAVEKNSLSVVGEPVFDAPDAIRLPDAGPLTYSFSVEVEPTFDLPNLVGLAVNRPKIEVGESHLEQAMQNLREQQGQLVPVEDRGVEPKDHLLADVHLRLDGNVIGHMHDATVIARPGRVGGIDIADLDAQLAGLKRGEKRVVKAKAPDEHQNEALRGKEVEIEFELKELKRLELAVIDQAFLDSLGFANMDELREALREQMLLRVQYDVQQAMREQVHKHLLDHVTMDVPSRLSDRQAQRIAHRFAMQSLMRGVPREQIEAAADQIRGGAREQAQRELKLFFILGRIAQERSIDVTEEQLNGRIALIASQQGRRPERLRQEMSKDGSLANLYVLVREQATVDSVLEQATITDVDMSQPPQAAPPSST